MAVGLPEGFVLDAQPASLPSGFVLDTALVVAKPTSAPQEQPTETPGFGERFAEDVRGRVVKGANALLRAAAGEQSLQESLFQIGSQEIGLVGDAFGEGLVSAVGALPDAIKQPVQNKIDELLSTEEGTLAIEALNKGGEAYNVFAENNPRAAANVEGLLIFATGGLTAVKGAPALAKGVQALPNAVKATPDAAKAALDRVTAIFTKESAEALQPQDLKTLSAAKYAQAADAGENFPDTVRGDLIKSLESAGSGKETLRKGSTDIQDALELMDARKGEALGLEGAQQIDEELGQLISKNYRTGLNADGKRLLDIQDEFRSQIQKSEGGKLLKEGRDLWSASKRMEDIDRIIKNAEFTDNPATSIKNGFRTLLKSDKRMRGYSPKERKLIEKAAKSGVFPNTLRTVVGSRLISSGLGGLLGGVGGVAAGVAISGAARKSAELLGKRATKNIQKEITSRATSSSLSKAIKESK